MYISYSGDYYEAAGVGYTERKGENEILVNDANGA